MAMSVFGFGGCSLSQLPSLQRCKSCGKKLVDRACENVGCTRSYAYYELEETLKPPSKTPFRAGKTDRERMQCMTATLHNLHVAHEPRIMFANHEVTAQVEVSTITTLHRVSGSKTGFLYLVSVQREEWVTFPREFLHAYDTSKVLINDQWFEYRAHDPEFSALFTESERTAIIACAEHLMTRPIKRDATLFASNDEPTGESWSDVLETRLTDAQFIQNGMNKDARDYRKEHRRTTFRVTPESKHVRRARQDGETSRLNPLDDLDYESPSRRELWQDEQDWYKEHYGSYQAFLEWEQAEDCRHLGFDPDHEEYMMFFGNGDAELSKLEELHGEEAYAPLRLDRNTNFKRGEFDFLDSRHVFRGDLHLEDL